MTKKFVIVFLLIVVGVIASYLLKSLLQDPWDIWVNKQADLAIKHEMKGTEGVSKEQLNMYREETRGKLKREAAGLREILSKPPPLKNTPFSIESDSVKQYEGPWPQTVESIMAAFDEKFTKSHAKGSEIDLSFPRAEWLATLLERGVIFEAYFEYSALMNTRSTLLFRKNRPDKWESGHFGIAPSKDWETFQDNYIDRKIWEVQQISSATKADHNVAGGTFMGPGDKVFLPITENRLYVDKTSIDTIAMYGAEISRTERYALQFLGIEPKGLEVIYIDDENGLFLDDEPPPFSWEAILEKAGPPPPDWEKNLPEGWEPPPGLVEVINKKWGDANTLSAPDTAAQQPHEGNDELLNGNNTQDHLEFTQAEKDFLEMLTKTEDDFDDDFDAELEKFLTQEGLIVPSEADFEKEFRKQFEAEVLTPKSLDKVMETLERHGLTEGFRRLQNEDPEVAKVIAELLGARRPQRKSQRYTPPPKPPEPPKPEED